MMRCTIGSAGNSRRWGSTGGAGPRPIPMPRKCPNQSPAPLMAHTRRKFFGAGNGRRAGNIYPAGGTRAQNAGISHGRDARRRDGPAGMRGRVTDRPDGAERSGENGTIDYRKVLRCQTGGCYGRVWVYLPGLPTLRADVRKHGRYRKTGFLRGPGHWQYQEGDCRMERRDGI